MPIVVQKYGGSSVAGVEKLRKVAQRVKDKREAGYQVVVVVSAMGDTTDELLALAKGVSVDPPRRELDMLLTCGERISMALLSMALQEMDVPAISFTGSQSGIITTDAHAQARIVEVRPYRIHDELARGKVVIVAGYQGVSFKKEVTTLGRGGSDTTAVALAAALDAEACEIYSDVDGVFSADPRVVPDARKLESLSYDEMQELASAGATVLNAQAVEWAKARGITILARTAHGQGTGTAVQELAVPTDHRLKGVTADAEMAVLSASEPIRLAELLEFLDARAVRGRTLDCEGSVGGVRRTVITVPLADIHGADALRRELATRFGDAVSWREDLGTVTCVGVGLNADWAPLRRALAAAEELGAHVHAAHTSPLQLTLLVDKAHLKALTARLHRELLGG
ncbi:aspartate kinase [Myxococcus xanthus DK 1622]|uniref:Aspartokinase n=1 Tax=Myxococcus xanthus (strain DK1622) TaxID=246197 RepID=Q1D2T9_MYXXD|nr:MULTISPECIES: aspartate kinase [Myxococcus]ABF91832.1 aspartate kinase [Myxococcus xanthus DK 1622]NOJ56336.1 aspartate kinase [Myxococcus xanthus]QPM77409.1 aspartate kinase [Myxococcus xanthus]QVW66476.1 aspartate kinase [Myxococcus xanthus DZ2]QZZ52545.1 Aspartokinase [Myxococcus xanthus]